MSDKSRPSRAALREWLQVRGRTQAKLARAVGVTQQTISALLASRLPSESLAKLIEAATGIDIAGRIVDHVISGGQPRSRRPTKARLRVGAQDSDRRRPRLTGV